MIVIGLCLPILMVHSKSLIFMKTVSLRFYRWQLIPVQELPIKPLPLRLNSQHKVCSVRRGGLLRTTVSIFTKAVLRDSLIQAMSRIPNTTLAKLRKQWDYMLSSMTWKTGKVFWHLNAKFLPTLIHHSFLSAESLKVVVLKVALTITNRLEQIFPKVSRVCLYLMR